MKKIVITNLGISLKEILRKNNALAAVLSLFIIGMAFLLILQYEKGIVILQNKWQPIYDIRKKDIFLDRSPIIKNQSADLTRYNIKIDLKDALNKGWGELEIQFCDKYSLILADSHLPSGVYYSKTDNSVKEYASKINYTNVIAREETAFPWSKNLNLHMECDLIEKTAVIRINDKFIEKLYLNPEARHYAVNLSINSKNFILHKVAILDHSGKILFSANYRSLFFYKLASQILIFFGVLIFLALACSEKRSFKRFLYFMAILLCIEGFLRIGEKYNQNFNIRQLNPKWKFEASTNLYGRYNDPKEIKIRNYYYPLLNPKIYQIPKPENTRRIICVGASPAAGWMLPSADQYAFPVLLEEKINPRERFKYEVVNAVLLGEVYINNPEPNVYLEEVLFKLDPDLILFYMRWSPSRIENSKKYLLENHILHDRAKKAMEGNSSWIKNDRLLYAALEFKRPIKEIVYLYNFLCNSYLFMGIENARKEVFNRLYYISHEPLHDKPRSYFDETLKLCKEKKIKILIVLPFHFFDFQSEQTTKREIMKVIRKNSEIYYLDLEKAFHANKDFLLAYDVTHPTEYGHMIIAEEILKKLTQMGFIDTDHGL